MDKESALKKAQAFSALAALLQFLVIILYAVAADYPRSLSPNPASLSDSINYYPMFQDIHVMMFIGFGFLMTFLRRYGFSALTYNFMIAAFALQWGAFLIHEIDIVFGKSVHKMDVNLDALVDGDIAAAAVLISFGAVLGRTTPFQLLLMSFFELIFYAINFHLVARELKVFDVGGSIVVHTFGAYFGLSVSWILGAPDNEDENKSIYHSDIFSMIGTLFLFVFWPSFNGYFAVNEGYIRALVNTTLSLCACVISTLITSHILVGKYEMVHIQNATLAGGVAVGASADMYLHPAGAMFIGLISGFLSVVGYYKISDSLLSIIGLNDTCGVHNLHGLPGILGGIISAIALLAGRNAYSSDYFNQKTANKQAGFQIAGLVVTLSISILSGLLVGLILKKCNHVEKWFLDLEFFSMTNEDYRTIGIFSHQNSAEMAMISDADKGEDQ